MVETMINDCAFVVDALDDNISLAVRIWSGFNKPLKHNILLLTPEETQLKAGRFIHYHTTLYAPEHQHFLFPRFKGSMHIKEIFDWIGENVKHPWAISLNYQGFKPIFGLENIFTFIFKEPSDAILFKLKWL
jgi:hypothetical protein